MDDNKDAFTTSNIMIFFLEINIYIVFVLLISIQKNYFDSLNNKLNMSDDSMMEVINRSKIKIKIFDEIMYILDLLDSQDYEYKVCDRVLKIIQGCMVLIK